MVEMKLSSAVTLTLILVVSGTWRVSHGQPQEGGVAPAVAAGGNPADNPAAMQLLSQAMYTRFSNSSAFFGPDVKKHLGFTSRSMLRNACKSERRNLWVDGVRIALLSKIAALRSFSLDKLHYWRESAAGMSSLAYFLAKDSVDHFNTIIKPAVYLSMFYFFNNPRSTILDNYMVLLCLVYCVTGIAYVLAIYYEPAPAQLWSVLLPVVLTLVANQEGDSFATKIGDYCYTKWALEAFLLANAERYSGVWLIQRCGAIRQRGYDLKDYYPCLAKLIATGLVSRAVAFFCLVTFQKK